MLQIATPKQSTSSPDSSRNVTIYIKSDSIVRQTNKVHLLSYTTMNNKHILLQSTNTFSCYKSLFRYFLSLAKYYLYHKKVPQSVWFWRVYFQIGTKIKQNRLSLNVLRFGNKLNEGVCRRFIFVNLFNSLYL